MMLGIFCLWAWGGIDASTWSVPLRFASQPVWTVRLRQTFPDSHQPADTAEDAKECEQHQTLDGYKSTKLRFANIERSASGYSRWGKYLTVQTFHYCEGVRLEKDERYFEPLEKRLTAFLTRLNAKTGEKLAWIYHPHISEDLYLFHEDKRGWFLFDEGSGDRIIHVPRDKAKHIKFPIY